jgi:signal transduction histidine kinase
MDKEENFDSNDYNVNVRMITFSVITVVFILVAIFFIKTYATQKQNIVQEMYVEWKGLEASCTEKIKRTEYILKLLAIQIEQDPNNMNYVKNVFDNYINRQDVQKVFNLKECFWFNYPLNLKVRSSPQNNQYIATFTGDKTEYSTKVTYGLSNKNSNIHAIMGIRDPINQDYIGSVVVDFDLFVLADRLKLRKKHEYTNFAIISSNSKVLVQSAENMNKIGLEGGEINNPRLLELINKIGFKEDNGQAFPYLDMVSGINYYMKKIPNQPFILLINIDAQAIKKDIFHKVVMKFLEISFVGLGFLLLIIAIYKRETSLRAKAEKASIIANQATRAKSDFLAFTAHEIRSPLGFIVTGSEVMQKQLLGPLPNAYQEYIDGINRNAHLILDFITDILDETHILEGNFSIVNEICVLQEIIDNTVKMNQARLDEKQSKIKIKIESKLPKLICDPRRMLQVINNLVSNAIKYSFDNSIINVVAKIVDENLHIEVIDQGVGMTKEESSLALTRYGTVRKKHFNFIESYGLGLPIVKMLLDAQDAKLVIDSKVNVGTTMRVIFPKYKLVYGQKVKVNKESEA